jgi:hypothetical protein
VPQDSPPAGRYRVIWKFIRMAAIVSLLLVVGGTVVLATHWPLTRQALTAALEEASGRTVQIDTLSMGLSNFAISFLSDDILRLRYISINGQLRKMLLVVKMRGSAHSIDMWEYNITEKGIIMGAPLRGYRGLTSGIPGPWSVVPGGNDPELRQDVPPSVPPESNEGSHE